MMSNRTIRFFIVSLLLVAFIAITLTGCQKTGNFAAESSPRPTQNPYDELMLPSRTQAPGESETEACYLPLEFYDTETMVGLIKKFNPDNGAVRQHGVKNISGYFGFAEPVEGLELQRISVTSGYIRQDYMPIRPVAELQEYDISAQPFVEWVRWGKKGISMEELEASLSRTLYPEKAGERGMHYLRTCVNSNDKEHPKELAWDYYSVVDGYVVKVRVPNWVSNSMKKQLLNVKWVPVDMTQ